MPMIEFEGPDGDRVEQFHHIPVDEVVINGAVYKKAKIPSRILVNVGAKPLTQAEEVKRDAYAYEQSNKPWTCKYSKAQVKDIWDL